MSSIPVIGWHLEYRNEAANSKKFYTVLIADNGVVVTAWGRIGTAGQSKIQKTVPEAADNLGRRQLFSKRAKGYATVHADVKFTMDEDVLIQACESNSAYTLTRAFFDAVRQPEFDGDKATVASHYDEFVNKAQRLLDGAADQPFDSVYGQYEELTEAWNGISEKHDEAAVTITLLRQLLEQRLMSGAL